MSGLSLIKNKEKSIKENFRFSWQDSLPAQRLLDVISSILAEEYIMTVKQNPEMFKEIASGASRPRNDT